jgi:hypothetical protein
MDLFHQRNSIPPAKSQVHDCQVKGMVFDRRQRFFPLLGGPHPVMSRFQPQAKQFQEGLIIIDHQYVYRGHVLYLAFFFFPVLCLLVGILHKEIKPAAQK